MLNAFYIRMIAMLTMIIDHVGHVFFEDQEIMRLMGIVALAGVVAQ